MERGERREGKKRRDEWNKKMKKKKLFFFQNKVLCAVKKVKDRERGGEEGSV